MFVPALRVRGTSTPSETGSINLQLPYVLLSLKSKPDVPVHNQVFRHRLIEEYDLWPNSLAYFAARAGIVLADLRVRHIPVQQYHTPDIPPWKVSTFSKVVSLSNFTVIYVQFIVLM